MAKLIDKLTVFALCFLLYATQVRAEYMVAAVIAAVTLSALCSYWENARLHMLCAAGAAGAALFFPQLIYFAPLLCYDILFDPAAYLALLFLPAALRARPGLGEAALLGAFLLLTLLLRTRTAQAERLRAEYTRMRDETREAAFDIEQKNKDLMEKQDYEVNLATLNERNRIAREIHDHVGHTMSRALLQVGALIATVRDEAALAGLRNLKETLGAGMDSIRSSVHDLHEDSVDLYAQLCALKSGFGFCPLRFDYDVQSPPPLKVRYAFLAIAKEGLSNIMRHSDATAAALTVREQPGMYQLVVEDNGSPRKNPGEGGMGLQGIAARAEGLGGRLHIDTGRGFRLFISVPKGASDENRDR